MDRGAWQAWNCKAVRHDLESEQQQPGRNADSPGSSREGPAGAHGPPAWPSGRSASVKKSTYIRTYIRTLYTHAVCAHRHPTHEFLMPTLILKRQSVSRAPDCVQH